MLSRWRAPSVIAKHLWKSAFWCVCLGIVACQPLNSDLSTPSAGEPSGAVGSTESRLSLDNATLEQTNQQGQAIWKIHTEQAVYSPNRKSARLKKLHGDIFQDGQLVLQVEAQQGEILNDGATIFLREDIVAMDPRNGATLRGEEVEWQPTQGILTVRKHLRGSQNNFKAKAKEGRYLTKTQRLELSGQIVATMEQPSLQLKTEHLVWDVEQQRVIGDRRTTIVRFDKKSTTDRLVGDKAEVFLAQHQALMRNNVEFRSVEPPVQIATNLVRWDYQQQIVESDQPTQIYHRADDISVTGNRVRVDLVKKVARAQGKTQSISQRQSIKLLADALLWRIPDQRVEALGNIIYEQGGDPPFNLTGERAVGRLNDNSVVVSGNEDDRVITEIFPE